jgi:PAS domain S-box-containing protein
MAIARIARLSRLMTLSNKVLAFCLPLLIGQVLLLGFMVNVNRAMKVELEQSNRARNISDAINKISKDSLEIFSYFGAEPGSLKSFSTSDPLYRVYVDRMKANYDELDRLAKDEPELAAMAKQSRANAIKVLTDLMAAKDLHEQASSRDAEKLKWKSIRETLKIVLKDELSYIGKEHEVAAARGLEHQTLLNEQIQNLTIVTLILDLVFAAVAAMLFTKNITNRLLTMCDNTTRLASSVPLNPPIGGKDELGKLDSEFHRMAFEIQNSAKKENAIISNARDLICSLDEGGRVVRANPACERLLGISSEDLLGRYLVDLVVSEDAPKLLAYLTALKNNETVPELEVTMRASQGDTIESLWSANWSRDEKTYFVVIHDISERRRAEELRREVMAMITHDLRSPLMTISNILDFYQRGVYTPAEGKGKDFLRSATRNADRMTALINDLLDIEKINSGMMELEKKTVALADCFSAVEETSSIIAKERGVEITFSPNNCSADGDRERIVRVLQNLVSNAIKFSPAKTTVIVTAEMKDEMVEVSITDQGPGIAPDKVALVFDRYRQVGASEKENTTGSGLGLAICKSIVELHGGQIWVESENGKGSVFKFTLPAAAARMDQKNSVEKNLS